jgi:hypothetical protein
MVTVRALLPTNLDIQFHGLEYFVVQSILDFAGMDGAKGVYIVKYHTIVNIYPKAW